MEALQKGQEGAHAAPEGVGRLPDDPAAFVAAAERLTNAHDAPGAAAVYAPDARLVLITNGAREEHHGRGAIERAWGVVLGAGERRGFRVRKTVVAVGGDTIVNRWEGEIGERADVHGTESWRFDADARVVEHQALTFLGVRPATSLAARLLVLAAAPRTALALLRAERRASRKRA